ncbi:MAG: SGNH/GDSL hydrolase family protein [Saprospiraceae bacterium]
MKTPSITYWKELYQKLEEDTTAYYQYDSLKGWAYRPNSSSKNGYYNFNGQGIRGSKVYSQSPSKDTIRIALLGNSAVFSAEVRDTQSLAYYLEKELQLQGKAVEVINFGVGGYGTDQALLNWKFKAKDFKPDLVIQGVMVWDFGINLNMFRYCVSPSTGIAYTKPRAILDAGSLKWVNYPTMPISQMVDSIVIDYEDRSFFEHEYFKKTKRYGFNVLDNLYLYQIGKALLNDSKSDIKTYKNGNDLMIKLVKELQKEVDENGANYIYMPLVSYDELYKEQVFGELPYNDFWKQFEFGRNTFSTFDLVKNESPSKYFMPTKKHYSPYGNQEIAKGLSNYLVQNELLKKRN